MALSAHRAARSDSRSSAPNIVFILADDLGWGDIGFNNPEVLTPHLNRLASEGVQLTNHYVLPICSPTRGALLTGLYPMRYGLQSEVVQDQDKIGLPLGHRLLSEELRDAGYRTAIVGKWHLGRFGAYRPMQRGFDSQYGSMSGWVGYHSHRNGAGRRDWYRDQANSTDQGYTTELIGNEAVSFIRRQSSDRPFFLYIPFNAVHSPLRDTPRKYLTRYAGTNLSKSRLRLVGAVSAVDDQVGRVMQTLESEGLRENTLVVFTSDNGGQLENGSSNLPFRSGKGSLYEGAVRVPAVVHWPAQFLPRRVDVPVHMVDWYPTLAGLASQGAPRSLDGVDIRDTLAVGAPRRYSDILINADDQLGALRMGPWKLILRNGIELYNVVDDPGETVNQAASHPELAHLLLTRLRAYQAMQDQVPDDQVPPPPPGSPRLAR
jgi:arylsulfatase A-like enzyme